MIRDREPAKLFRHECRDVRELRKKAIHVAERLGTGSEGDAP